MKYILKKLIFFNRSFLVFLIYGLFITQPLKLYPGDNSNNLNLVHKNIEDNKSEIKSEYILGIGDSIYIEFEGIQEYSKIYSINPEGNLQLPEINNIYAKGLTLSELKNRLINVYEEFIVAPSFNLSITSYRNVKVYISGEVNSPGLYELDYLQENKVNQSTNPIGVGSKSVNNTVSRVPRLFDAIKLANGITNNADLSDIEIIRKNSISQGGGKIKGNVNLLRLVTNGDQTQNVRLLDSDYILVKKSKTVLKEQILAINKTNLSPEFMKVYITGNVIKAGQLEVEKGTSLVQAIALSGGKKIMTGNIEFLRFDRDGITSKRTFRYDANAKINTEKNPILMHGDIINVRRTLLGSTTEILKEISSPVLTGYGIYSLFD